MDGLLAVLGQESLNKFFCTIATPDAVEAPNSAKIAYSVP